MGCFKERKNMAVEENLKVTINFYKKQYLNSTSNIIWKKTIYCNNKIHTGENVFYSCYF